MMEQLVKAASVAFSFVISLIPTEYQDLFNRNVLSIALTRTSLVSSI